MLSKQVCASSSHPSPDDLRAEVALLIRNLLAIRNPLLAPNQTLEIVVHKLVERYRVPIVDLIGRVRQTLLQHVQRAAAAHFSAYPLLEASLC